MDTMTDPPSGPPAEPPTPGREPAPAPPPRDDQARVIGGVAFRVAAGLGVDPLWVRLGFVALAIAGGLGVALYAALWLVLIAGRRPGRTPWIWMVGAGALMWAWVAIDVSVDGALAGIVVLGGAALALWQPRTEPVPIGGSGDDARTSATPSAPATDATTASIWPWAPRPRRIVHREPSIVGRTTLALSLLVVAGGALVDHADGGRLHPEQWLGAAAAVCGVGLVVSAFRGRAPWLLFPAAMFAGTGWVAGHAARAGVDLFDIEAGVGGVDGSTPAGARLQPHSSVGDVSVHVYEAPQEDSGEPVQVDARVGIGDITIDVDDEVTVEIRPHVHDGVAVVHDGPGVPQRHDAAFTVGPEGPPDVIVRAEVSRGDVEVRRHDIFSEEAVVLPIPEAPNVPPLEGIDVSTVRDLGEGIQMTSDGTVILPDTAAVLSPDGDVWLRDNALAPEGVTYVATDTMGEYLLLPNQTVVTPHGTVIDVPAIREELASIADRTSGATIPSEGEG